MVNLSLTTPAKDSSPKTDGDLDSLLGTMLGGKFLLVDILGRGGMGTVFRAEHQTLGIPVAVKVMSPQLATVPAYLRRFAREARAISLLNHPNIVRVLDFDALGGVPYIAMELLRGISLGDRLDRDGPLSLAEVRDISLGILWALDAAHQAGIVHRDLKPDNVFLAQEPSGISKVKVVDFGLAHVHDPLDHGPTLTTTDLIAGTPSYMSPEQCRTLSVGPAADLYSFGCILTALLQRGHPPFEGSSSAETMTMHMFSPVPALQREASEEPVSIALEGLRRDLLSKAADRRPQPASRVAMLLEAAMDPSSQSSALSTRKGNEPLGGREERVVNLGFVRPASNTVRILSAEVEVELWGLDSKKSGIGLDAKTALSVKSIRIVEGKCEQAAAVLLDAGDDLAGAVALLQTKKAERRPIVVCVSGLGIDGINKLIGAGAADVLSYPIAGDSLAKKIERVIRRKR